MGGTYIRNFICNFISHRKKEEKMKLKKRNVFIGITSFLIVLFTMPLGHALMILMEHLMEPVHALRNLFHGINRLNNGHNGRICQRRYSTNSLGAIRRSVILDRMD